MDGQQCPTISTENFIYIYKGDENPRAAFQEGLTNLEENSNSIMQS